MLGWAVLYRQLQGVSSIGLPVTIVSYLKPPFVNHRAIILSSSCFLSLLPTIVSLPEGSIVCERGNAGAPMQPRHVTMAFCTMPPTPHYWPTPTQRYTRSPYHRTDRAFDGWFLPE